MGWGYQRWYLKFVEELAALAGGGLVECEGRAHLALVLVIDLLEPRVDQSANIGPDEVRGDVALALDWSVVGGGWCVVGGEWRWRWCWWWWWRRRR